MLFKDKSILITGGAGTLGKVLVRKLLEHNPKKVIVFSRDDQKHFKMEQEFGTPPRLRYWIGDIRDMNRLRMAFQDVDYVIHTAALKHVDRGEANPLEYKHTIVDGAENIIQAAIECGVEKVVALSTDKACAPLNTYGACKLMSDKLFMAANSFSKTDFSVIRYGNVIGSNGSIVDKLKESKDNKIYITDRRMTRFWISDEYASNLVLHLLQFMNGGELLIPKIPSCNVLEFLKLLKPNSEIIDIPIRPGEKIHETMFTKEDSRNIVNYRHYYIMYNSFPEKAYRTFAGNLGHPTSPIDYCSDSNSIHLCEEKIQNLINGKYEFPKL